MLCSDRVIGKSYHQMEWVFSWWCRMSVSIVVQSWTPASTRASGAMAWRTAHPELMNPLHTARYSFNCHQFISSSDCSRWSPPASRRSWSSTKAAGEDRRYYKRDWKVFLHRTLPSSTRREWFADTATIPCVMSKWTASRQCDAGASRYKWRNCEPEQNKTQNQPSLIKTHTHHSKHVRWLLERYFYVGYYKRYDDNNAEI